MKNLHIKAQMPFLLKACLQTQSLSSSPLCTAVNVCWFHLQAWEDTYGKWDQATKQILNFPKNKADDGQVSMEQRGLFSFCTFFE